MGVSILLIENEHPYSGFSELKHFISIVWLIGIFCCSGIVFSYDISEETLPPITTLTEIEHQLNNIEDNFRKMESSTVLDQLSRVQQNTEDLNFKPDSSVLENRIDNVIDRICIIKGALHFYNNQRKDAAQEFQKLFNQTPNATLSGKIASPELAIYFESIRELFVGFISVSTSPENADIYIDDEHIGVSPLLGIYILAGDRIIHAEHEGFVSSQKLVSISPGKESKLNMLLVKSSGSCWVMTSPPGVQILLDNEAIGETSGVLTDHGELYQEYIKQARDSGLNPYNVSAPLQLDYIPFGEHTIMFSRRCYKQVQYRINITPGDFYIPPIKLEPSYGELTITSEPSNAEVFLDGESNGQTPLFLESTCTGKRKIEVKFGSYSVWSDTIMLTPELPVILHAQARPTLLFLGCTGQDSDSVKITNKRIENWFRELAIFNIIDSEKTQTCRVQPAVATLLENIAQYDSDSEIPWPKLLETVPAVLYATHDGLFAIAKTSESDSGLPGSVFLIYPGLSKPDVIPIPAGIPSKSIPDSVKSICKSLPSITRLWTGLKLVESSGKILVTSIENNGPAVILPIHTGDNLVLVNQHPIDSIAEYHHVLENPYISCAIQLRFQRNGIQHNYNLETQRTPMMIPLSDPLFPYNLMLAYLKEITAIPSLKDSAFLNLGICYYALEDPQSALSKGFNQCQLDEIPGVSLGTLAYLKALAFQKIGNIEKSIEMAKTAAKYPYSTIIDADGPKIINLVNKEFELLY